MTIGQKKNKQKTNVMLNLFQHLNNGSRNEFGMTLGNNKRRVAFTLAEVLIVISVIGVVASLTIPTLIHNINDKVTEHKRKVFEERLAFGMRDMAVKSTLMSYSNGYDFAKNLSHQYKVFGVFNTSEIPSAYPVGEVIIDNKGNTMDVSKITASKNLQLKDDTDHTWSNPVAVISTDGVPIIFSYNTKCTLTDAEINGIKDDNSSKYSSYETMTQCIAGVFDLNGVKSPNKMGKDIISLNGGSLATGCSGTDISGLGCVSGMLSGTYNGEEAKTACTAQGMTLPTKDQLLEIYKHKSELGISSGGFWSSSGGDYSGIAVYFDDGSWRNDLTRMMYHYNVLCIGG